MSQNIEKIILVRGLAQSFSSSQVATWSLFGYRIGKNLKITSWSFISDLTGGKLDATLLGSLPRDQEDYFEAYSPLYSPQTTIWIDSRSITSESSPLFFIMVPEKDQKNEDYYPSTIFPELVMTERKLKKVSYRGPKFEVPNYLAVLPQLNFVEASSYKMEVEINGPELSVSWQNFRLFSQKS